MVNVEITVDTVFECLFFVAGVSIVVLSGGFVFDRHDLAQVEFIGKMNILKLNLVVLDLGQPLGIWAEAAGIIVLVLVRDQSCVVVRLDIKDLVVFVGRVYSIQDTYVTLIIGRELNQ